jgi:hypothetical protein
MSTYGTPGGTYGHTSATYGDFTGDAVAPVTWRTFDSYASASTNDGDGGT